MTSRFCTLMFKLFLAWKSCRPENSGLLRTLHVDTFLLNGSNLATDDRELMLLVLGKSSISSVISFLWLFLWH